MDDALNILFSEVILRAGNITNFITKGWVELFEKKKTHADQFLKTSEKHG